MISDKSSMVNVKQSLLKRHIIDKIYGYIHVSCLLIIPFDLQNRGMIIKLIRLQQCIFVSMCV